MGLLPVDFQKKCCLALPTGGWALLELTDACSRHSDCALLVPRDVAKRDPWNEIVEGEIKMLGGEVYLQVSVKIQVYEKCL